MPSSRKFAAKAILGLLSLFAALILPLGIAAAEQARAPELQANSARIVPLETGNVPTCTPSEHAGTTAAAGANSCIDVLFVADKHDYKLAANGSVVRSSLVGPDTQFIEDLQSLIKKAFVPDSCNTSGHAEDCQKLQTLGQKFRFWHTTDLGEIETAAFGKDVSNILAPAECIVERGQVQDPRSAADEVSCLSMDVIAIIHDRGLNDASIGRKMTSEWDKPRTFLHELGHAAMGMEDEYPHDNPHMAPLDKQPPNLFQYLKDCRDFAERVGFSPDECDKLPPTKEGRDWGFFRFNHMKAIPRPLEAPLMFKAKGELVPFDDLFFRASGKVLAYIYEQCAHGACGNVDIKMKKKYSEDGLTPARSLVISFDVTRERAIDQPDPCAEPTATPTPAVIAPVLATGAPTTSLSLLGSSVANTALAASPIDYRFDSGSLEFFVMDAPPSSLLLNNSGPVQVDLSYLPNAPDHRLDSLYFFNPAIALVECDETEGDAKDSPLQGAYYFLPETRLTMVVPFYADIANFRIQPGWPDQAPITYPADFLTSTFSDQIHQVLLDHFDDDLRRIGDNPPLLSDDDLRVLVQRQDLQAGLSSRGIDLGPWAEVGKIGHMPDTLDVGAAVMDDGRAADAYLVSAQVLETLVRKDPQGKTTPGLAEVVPVDAAGSRWSVRLAPQDVHFHDGTPLDQAAVEANIQRWKDAGLLDVAGIETGAADELILTLARPQADLASVLASPQFGIHSPAAMQRPGYGSPEVGIVGTGPYSYTRGAPDAYSAQVILQRNDNYHGKRPSNDYLTISYFPPGTSLTQTVSSNQVDVLAIPPDLASTIKPPADDTGRKLQEQTIFSTLYLAPDVKPGSPLAYPQVREALDRVLNRRRLADFLPPDASATDTILPGSQQGQADADLEEAKALLAKAGQGQGFPLDLFYSDAELTRYPGLDEVLEQLKLDLGNLGIHVQTHPLAADSLKAARSSGALRQELQLINPMIAVPAFGPAPQPTAPAQPPPVADNAIAFVGVLDANTARLNNVGQLLEAPGAADAVLAPQLLTLASPLPGPIAPDAIVERAEQERIVLPFAVTERVTWLANKGVSGITVAGADDVLSLSDLTVTR